MTQTAKAAVRRASKLAVIPGGMTKKLQPLDISVNKSFKAKLCHQWEEWMMDNARHTYTKGGRMRRPSYAEMCRWIVNAWNDITANCIQNGFRKCLIDDNQDDIAVEAEPAIDLSDDFDGFN